MVVAGTLDLEDSAELATTIDRRVVAPPGRRRQRRWCGGAEKGEEGWEQRVGLQVIREEEEARAISE